VAVTSVVMTWQAAGTFGWGVGGWNIFCHWAVDRSLAPLMVAPIAQADLRLLDPLRAAAIGDAVRMSNEFSARVAATGPQDVLQFDGPVVHALGNGCAPTRFRGTRNIGRIIFEDTRFDHFDAKMSRYDALVAVSRWGRDAIAAHTSRPVHLIHEGVDPSLFWPGPRSGLLDPKKFYVFTGGKVEYRKAQDLVILAFRAFASRHPDAVLVTCWHSPWPKISAGFKGRLSTPLSIGDDGRLDVCRWAADNGISPAQFVDLGVVPNQLMPQVLREMNVALQPSRAEAGTNIPAMEAMACGVPVVAPANTGMKDIVEGSAPGPLGADETTCLPLRCQGPVEGFKNWGTDGWGESDVDEAVDALEFAYTERDRAKAVGQRGASWVVRNGWTWADHASALKRVVMPS
jgi:glycosyltransferase involved in cell wall biosynthesis